MAEGFARIPQNILNGKERTPTHTHTRTHQHILYLRPALQRGSPANVKSLDPIRVPSERRAPAPFRKHARLLDIMSVYK